MTGHADFVVVGLGAMGAACLYQLATRGASVVGVDRWAPPHAQGSSHGETRITREAVGEGADYVPLVRASHRIWRELEAETGEKLFEACGALVIAPGTGESSHHGKPDFVARSAETAAAYDIPHETMTGAEAARRFPQFGLAGDEKVYFEPGGGYVFPERCIAAQLARAVALGAEILSDTQVRSIEPSGDHVVVETSRGRIVAGQAIVAAGGWAAELLGAPFDRLLTVNRQVLHWFELDDDADWRGEAPVFIWMHGPTDVDYLYGFPPLPGDMRVKVATEQYAAATTADAMPREISAEESAGMHRVHVAGRLRGASTRVAKAAACLYTVTPDNGFIIDRHPRMDRVIAISACSGHGFKHSAGIGEAVAKAATTGDWEALGAFAVGRFEPPA